ncbi:MAG: hypothetical protein HUK00_07420 [Bacteroidaceae bacterium]|nr:hypothetical protein [Bacteroidaceae bacterium]
MGIEFIGGIESIDYIEGIEGIEFIGGMDRGGRDGLGVQNYGKNGEMQNKW